MGIRRSWGLGEAVQRGAGTHSGPLRAEPVAGAPQEATSQMTSFSK